MNYTTILTSKGTTTIPKEIRDFLGVKPGARVFFTKNDATGKVEIDRVPSIEEVRATNRAWLKKRGTANKPYQSGDGFASLFEKDQTR